jgi:hypothetical protein
LQDAGNAREPFAPGFLYFLRAEFFVEQAAAVSGAAAL